MRNITQTELNRILQQHSLWLQTGGDQGECANLQHINLFGASLRRANLSHIDLSGADLTGATLSGADLTGAQLSYANLTGANLHRADLWRADLSHTNLYRAYLWYANLAGAQISAATRLHQCSSFEYLTCSPDALPWLILHPKWPEWKSTVTVVEDPVNS